MEPSDHAVEPAIMEALLRCGHAGAEIEWRLGEKTPEGFVPGVPKDAFERAKATLEKLTGTSGEELETIERIAADGTKRIENINGSTTTWMRKNKIMHIDMPKYRVSFAQETSLDPPPQKPQVNFEHTRRKRRTSFRYKMWRVDLTVVLPDLDAEEYVYEIELEIENIASVFMYEMSYICGSATRTIDFLLNQGL